MSQHALESVSTMPAPRRSAPATPSLSVVIPLHNERDNIGPLLDEVAAALKGPLGFEIICVDDASSDGTLDVLRSLHAHHPKLRVLAHPTQAGQSLAIRNGVLAARAPWIATLDGDGQNCPSDLPHLLARRATEGADVRLICGWRVERRDSWSKRMASRLANAVRRRLLRDDTPDTGCGIKVFERNAFLDLPYFDHMHRYLPALMQRAGWHTVSMPVSHRERGSGRSNYNNFGRLRVGLVDLCGVAWLIRRSRVVAPRADDVAATGRHSEEM